MMLREPLATTCSDPFHRSSDGHNKHCGGGRTLTDAEVLSLLLTEECGKCDGEGGEYAYEYAADGSRLEVERSCPSCGGSGRTLREGVQGVVRMGGMSGALYPSSVMGDQPDGLVVPVSMLEGGESDV